MKGEELDPQNIEETVKFGGGHIMVWGCMMATGVGTMCRIEGTMNAERVISYSSRIMTRSIHRSLLRGGSPIMG